MGDIIDTGAPIKTLTMLSSRTSTMLLSAQAHGDDDREALSARWKYALHDAKSPLGKEDFKLLQKFTSPEALMDDLQARQQKAANSWVRTAADAVSPAVRVLKSSLTTFVLAMAPHSVESALVWGLVHLLADLSLENKRKWDDFTERLFRIRRSLGILGHISQNQRLTANDLSDALFDVFTRLIVFWAEAVKWMRTYPIEKANEPHSASALDHKLLTTKLEDGFSLAMTAVEHSIAHLSKLADLLDRDTHLRLVNEQKSRHEDLLDRVELRDGITVYPVHLLPRRSATYFHGRDDIFSEIDTALEDSHLTQRSVLLHGLGGVGKTQTALSYAWRERDKYDVVLWIRSETSSSLKASIVEIARGMNFPGAWGDKNEDQMLLMLQTWFRMHGSEHESGRRWLMIFDNIDDIDDIHSSGNGTSYIPTSPGAIIITSRRADSVLPDTIPISLKPFGPADGAVLLKKSLRFHSRQLRGQADEDSLVAFSKALGGLPLALRAVAGLMNARSTTSALDFLRKFEQHSRRLLMDKAATKGIEYNRDISTAGASGHILDQVWRMSFEALEDRGKMLISILAFLSADSISTHLFGEAAAVDAPVQAMLEICGADDFGLDEAIVELTDVSLIDRDGSELSIHRLVQDAFVHFSQPSELHEAFCAAVHVVHQHFPRRVHGRPMHSQWEQCRGLIQHGQHLADRFASHKKADPEFLPPPRLAELLKSCAWYLFEMADHQVAIKMLDVAMSACQDKKSELYAHLLNTEGCCCFELNELTKCRRLWDEALQIRRSWAQTGSLAAEEELANQSNNYGNLESAEGRLDDALRYFEQAKAIRRRLGDDAIVPLGVSHMTTGRAYFLKGMPTEAMANYRLAEEIFLAKFGPNAHFMAHLHFAYGNLELVNGAHVPAMKCYNRAREILEADTPYHLLLAATLYKIACLEVIGGRQQEALKLLNDALAIAERREADGDIARIVMKKASLLKDGSVEDRQNAEALVRKVETILLRLPDNVLMLEDHSEDDWNSWVCPYWR